MNKKKTHSKEELDVSYGKGKELNFTLVPVIFLVLLCYPLTDSFGFIIILLPPSPYRQHNNNKS